MAEVGTLDGSTPRSRGGGGRARGGVCASRRQRGTCGALRLV